MPVKILHFENYYYPVAKLALNGVSVSPGRNQLSKDEAKAIESHPDYAQWIKMNFIEEVSNADEPQSQNSTAEVPAEQATSETGKQVIGQLFDITTTRANKAIDLIEQITDPEVLASLLEAEENGSQRSTVIDAIKKQLGVD